jgi:hypothetical protein
VDRFIQLAVLGAARAAAQRLPAPDCGLYLASGHGPMGNNIDYQDQLLRQKLVPKPFNFINTLGSAAGYYVAKELGLKGNNQFVTRIHASLRAVLDLALTDLALGRAPQALLGCIEECTLPHAEQRRRQGLPPDFGPLAEGSHYLLLAPDSRLPPALTAQALSTALAEAAATGAPLFVGARVDPGIAAAWPGPRHQPILPWHDSLDAAVLAGFEGRRLWWLDADPAGGYNLVELVYE